MKLRDIIKMLVDVAIFWIKGMFVILVFALMVMLALWVASKVL